MKTIIHLVLSDSERNDLARRMYRDPVTKVLATRREVTDFVHAFIDQEIRDGREEEVRGETVSLGETEPEETRPVEPRGETTVEHSDEARASPEPGLIPDWPKLHEACTRVLEHIADNKETDTINVGWCISILAATGAI